MRYRIAEAWQAWDDKVLFAQDVFTKDYDRVIFCCLNEWEWPICCSRQLFDLPIEELNERLKEKNITLEIIYSGKLRDEVENYSNIVTTSTNIWFAIAGLSQLKYFDVEYLTNTKLEYPFISLNHRSHPHRCLLIDLLARENLVDKGAITWHNVSNSSYDWKYFEPKTLQLTDGFEPMWDRPPKEYFQSFCQLISESTVRSTIMSEKAFSPLFFKKPFIVQSAPGFYEHMDEYGFVRYDEIFNYNFDKEDDDTIRTEMIIENVKQIANKSLAELEQLLIQLTPKLEHNYKIAYNLATDSSNYPPILQDILNYYNQGNDIPLQVYHPYNDIKNMPPLP